MLKVLIHEQQPLRWWFEQHLLGRIDMAPSYQRRGEIWSKWKRAHLIDSILNDFDVPKFYVANFHVGPANNLNPNKTGYAIIDGKQRLGAIFAFFSDEIALNQSFVLDDNPNAKLGQLKYSDLRSRFPQLAHKIDSFVPTMMSVITDSERKIEELFVRLNTGEAANGAERRNAAGGPVPVIVRELSQHLFFGRKIRFNIKRMQEHNLLWKLLLFEFKKGFVDTKARNLDEFAETANVWSKARPDDQQDNMGEYDLARDRVFETLELLAGEFNDSDVLLAKQGEIPIYYWAVRQHPDWIHELRDFILEFTDALRDNLHAQKADPNAGIAELSSYYTMSRTTNDQASLEGRYRIFEKRFAAFRKPLGRRPK